MTAKRRGITVYHGTLSEQAPHNVFQHAGAFHAGTRKAAVDRLIDQDALQPGDEGLEVSQPQIHVYEIMPDTPVSMLTYSDPDYGLSDIDYTKPAVAKVAKYSSKGLLVNRGNITRSIKKYKNLIEDPGSTSYLIPTQMVPNRIRHLGTQFYGYNPDVEDPASDVELVQGDSNWWQHKRSTGVN